MRIVATSDFHGTLPDIPECDLLLIGGDVCPVWDHHLPFQRKWLLNDFAEWLDVQPASVIVGIGGNHDFALQDDPALGHALPWAYFNNEARVISPGLGVPDLKVFGSPYSNRFGKWAFMKSEGELAEMYRAIPRDIDILLVHGPPYGFGDKVPGKVWVGATWTEERVGSTSLANQLAYDMWPNLKMVVFGHIHEGYGEYSLKQARVLNVSQMNDEYRPVNPPMVIDL